MSILFSILLPYNSKVSEKLSVPPQKSNDKTLFSIQADLSEFLLTSTIFALKAKNLQIKLQNEPIQKNIMENTSKKEQYSPKELEEFRELILAKLTEAQKRLYVAQASLDTTNQNITQDKIKNIEDCSIVEEQENINYLAIRLQKFIQNLRAALVRIKNGTYGICVETKKLIDKKRLLLVPHTTHSLEAKNKRDKNFSKEAGVL